jgi:hypothetical protein
LHQGAAQGGAGVFACANFCKSLTDRRHREKNPY